MQSPTPTNIPTTRIGRQPATRHRSLQDLNGDRMIDERDMAPIGYTIMPELTPSVAVNVGYAGF